ncbi:hypothetical protein EMIT0215P_40125 [Pseudomonas serboccidentalis]
MFENILSCYVIPKRPFVLVNSHDFILTIIKTTNFLLMNKK